ncbi:hypothetical protein ACQ4N7_20800 [Nodosilinea sp. AN01ver1]|uniref:hypothetical protein n=1 Tax=Nodosilinea sp. AN01ver1 TaxID=3423362 RepID=UPI003D321167
MKHADSHTLTRLRPLLDQVRQRVPPLKEPKVGTFYLKSAAFLHFHDDPSGLFADLKVQGNWQRYPVNHEADYIALLQALDQQLPGAGPNGC